MITIISGMNKEIKKIIGLQEYNPEADYRNIDYIVLTQMHDKVLLYNTMTRELIELSQEEYELQQETVKSFLVKHWFMIPFDLDGKSISYMINQAYAAVHPRRRYGRLELCTIFSTTECNASCPYCYEAGCIKRTMTDDVAQDVAEYIKNHCAARVQLKWFGGEPLCNSNAIDIICRYLSENGVNYYSSMVTNGFLINRHTDEEIRDLWNLKRVQITLDGTESIYNQVKGIKSDNAFGVVMGNIQRLLDLGVHVTIRLNLSKKNVDDLKNLVDVLFEKFSGYNNLYVYGAALFEGSGSPPIEFTPKERKDVYGDLVQLQEYIRNAELCGNPKIPEIRRCHCMADNGRSCVILPGGELSLCEHHCDDEFYGTIYEDKFDRNVLDSWHERADEYEECRKCFYYPQCIRLKKCPTDTKKCTEEMKDYKRYQVESMIMSVYDRWKKGQLNGAK